MTKADENIKRNIVEELCRENRVDASRVTVSVEEGNVILSGKALTHSARQAAWMVASSVPGVLSVENQIVIDGGSVFPLPEQTRSKAMQLLARDPVIDEKHIEVKVKEGWVYLEGSVPTISQKSWAEEFLYDLPGIIGFVNKLSVVPSQSLQDEDIARNIMDNLHRKPSLDINRINVRVDKGSVILYGKVANWKARLEAYKAALYTDGVTDIMDDLLISPD